MIALRYAALFLALCGFTVASVGYSGPSGLLAEVASLQAEDPSVTSYLLLANGGLAGAAFGDQGVVVRVSDRQVDQLMGSLGARARVYEVNGQQITVLRVDDNPTNRTVLEAILGESLEDSRNSRVVRDEWIIPFVTSAPVS